MLEAEVRAGISFFGGLFQEGFWGFWGLELRGFGALELRGFGALGEIRGLRLTVGFLEGYYRRSSTEVSLKLPLS